MSLITSNDDILTDNTQIEYCKQCEKCINWDPNGNPFGNQYDKAYCSIFSYPNAKPPQVINNEGDCKYRIEK